MTKIIHSSIKEYLGCLKFFTITYSTTENFYLSTVVLKVF